MIDALIGGRIYGNPAERTTSGGRRYAIARVRAAVREGDAYFVNVICFDDVAVTALLALSEGDSVAISGELTPKGYIPPNGDPRPPLDLLAHAVLTPYHVTRKRQATSEEAA